MTEVRGRMTEDRRQMKLLQTQKINLRVVPQILIYNLSSVFCHLSSVERR
jgi:hypothetical protein